MDVAGPLRWHCPKYCSKSQEYKDHKCCTKTKPNQKIFSKQLLISYVTRSLPQPRTHRTVVCQAVAAVGGAVILLLSPGMKLDRPGSSAVPNQWHPVQIMDRLSPCTAASAHSQGPPNSKIILVKKWHCNVLYKILHVEDKHLSDLNSNINLPLFYKKSVPLLVINCNFIFSWSCFLPKFSSFSDTLSVYWYTGL